MAIFQVRLGGLQGFDLTVKLQKDDKAKPVAPPPHHPFPESDYKIVWPFNLSARLERITTAERMDKRWCVSLSPSTVDYLLDLALPPGKLALIHDDSEEHGQFIASTLENESKLYFSILQKEPRSEQEGLSMKNCLDTSGDLLAFVWDLRGSNLELFSHIWVNLGREVKEKLRDLANVVRKHSNLEETKKAKAEALVRWAENIYRPPEWSSLPDEPREELIRHFTQFGWMREIRASTQQHAKYLAERVLTWLSTIDMDLPLLEKGDISQFEEGDLERLDQQIRWLLGFYSMMREETRNKSELADFFWKRIGPESERLLHEIVGRLRLFPTYLFSQEGACQIPGREMTVAVLGDVGATRTAELAARGHNVVFIDRSSESLGYAKRLVPRLLRSRYSVPSGKEKGRVTYVEGCWYKTPHAANYVEAFYPLSADDVPENREQRRQHLTKLLNDAIHSKLADGDQGKGVFIVSEVKEIIEDLAEIIKANPEWELLEVKLSEDEPPIMGGYQMTGNGDASWMIYRRRTHQPPHTSSPDRSR